MADKHSLNYDVRELKLGSSFTNNKTSQYHTIKYDFKPASVDVNKMATVDVGTNNQVTVTVPHLDGAGVPQTVFKGSQRPYTKECVIIIDKVTGEITIEKLSSNIQVKKTRQETAQKPRPLTPVIADFTNTTQRSSSRTRVATNRRTNNTNASSGQPNSQSRFNNNAPKPQNMVRSPSRVKTSPPQAPWSAGGNSTLASLPMIGLDDAPASSPGAPRAHPAPAPAPHAAHPPPAQHAPHAPPAQHMPHVPHAGHAPHVQHMHAPPPAPTLLPSSAASQDDSSSSSSSDSDSDSGSGSDSDDSSARPAHPTHPAHAAHPTHPTHPAPPPTNGTAGIPALPSVLNDDLCLSESGSDSD